MGPKYNFRYHLEKQHPIFSGILLGTLRYTLRLNSRFDCDRMGTHSLSRRATSPRSKIFWLADIFPILGIYPGVFALPKSTANKMSRPSEEPCRSREGFSLLVLFGWRAVLNLSSQIAEGICQRQFANSICPHTCAHVTWAVAPLDAEIWSRNQKIE